MVSSVHGYHRLWNRDPKVCVFNWLDLASRAGHLDARHGLSVGSSLHLERRRSCSC